MVQAMTKWRVLVLVLIGAGMLLWGCGLDGPVESEPAKGPRIVAKLMSTAQATDLQMVILTVEGEGIETPVADTLLANPGQRTFSFELDVPIGADRTFTVRALDIEGELVYEGSHTADVDIDAEPIIPILIKPKRFTLLVTPSDTTVSAGETFEVGVEVYGVEELFGVSFEVEYDGSLLTVEGNPETGDFLDSEVELVMVEEGRVSVSVTKKRGEEPMSGSGRLARIPFRAEGVGVTSVRLVEETLTLQRGDGTPVPGRGGMILGGARVVIE
jgi:hypothetical protein